MYASTLKVLSALVANTAILLYPRWFLLWLPLLPVAGLWVTLFEVPREWSFLYSYLEFGLVYFFFLTWWTSQKDRFSVLLLLVPLLALPSLLFAEGHLAFSGFLFMLLLAGPGVYHLYLTHMPGLLNRRIPDLAVLMWVATGLLIKIYAAITSDTAFIYQRSGRVWGSNHVGGILFLLLPFVRSRGVLAVAVAFLLMQFSRGIYGGLAVFALLWFVMVERKQVVLVALAVGALAVGSFFLLPSGTRKLAEAYLIERLRIGAPASSIQLAIGDFANIIEGVLVDSRWEIYKAALEMSAAVYYLGVGLGGFAWGVDLVGFPIRFSNAHNLYLTSLAEGGLLFTIGLIWLVLLGLKRAYRVSKPAFVGLLVWAFYGFYSGEIYEAADTATAVDYYNLLFVFAYVSYLHRSQAPVAAGAPGISKIIAPARLKGPTGGAPV